MIKKDIKVKKGRQRENHCDHKIRVKRGQVYATGNKWLIEDFNRRYGR